MGRAERIMGWRWAWTLRSLAPALLASAVGCPAPDLPDGRFACSRDSDCPAAMRCETERCVSGKAPSLVAGDEPVLTGDRDAASPGRDGGGAPVDAGRPPGSDADSDVPPPEGADDSGMAESDAGMSSGPCATDQDCFDFNSCTRDVCVEGECRWPMVQDCCLTNEDCLDADVCTSDYCDFDTHRCRNDVKSGCCTRDQDCDGNDCEKGSCDPVQHACSYTAVPGCCKTAADCNDNIVCTDDACGANGVCTHVDRKGCCREQSDCDDRQACTIDACDVATGACENRPRSCDDLNACTDDACSESDGRCVFTPKPCAGCCSGGLCYEVSAKQCATACPSTCATCCNALGACLQPYRCALTTTDPAPVGLSAL